MINEGRPVYGLAGYVNEITTFGELDCTVLCTQPSTHTPNTTSCRCTHAHVHVVVSEIRHPMYTEGARALLCIIKPFWYTLV